MIEILICLTLTLLIGYQVGYHRGEVDKHKQIFDLIGKEMGWNEKETTI